MIRVRPKGRIVVISGIHSGDEIAAAIIKATKTKRIAWSKWTFISSSSPDASGSQSGLQYDPAKDEAPREAGFKRQGK